MTTRVTVEDVERVAELGHLKLTPEESRGMQHDLNAILDYVDELNGLDTKGVTPLEQVSELERCCAADAAGRRAGAVARSRSGDERSAGDGRSVLQGAEGD